MEQKEIIINEVKLPYIVDENGVEWYPVSYLYEKVLEKSQVPSKKDLLKKCGENSILKFNIDFAFLDTNTQECNCVNRDSVKIILSKIQIGRLSENQREKFNNVLNYFNMENIEDKEFRLFNYNEINKVLKEHDEFISDCIKYYIDNGNYDELKWVKCNTCGKWYPLYKDFYLRNTYSHQYNKICRNCQNNCKINHMDNRLNTIHREYGLEIYKAYRDKDVIKIYNHWFKNNINDKLPKELQNKESYLTIIKYLYNNNIITNDNITSSILKNDYGLIYIGTSNFISMGELCKELLGEEYKFYPWKYKKLQIKLTTEEGKIAFSNYIKENNVITDIFECNYVQLLSDARLTQFNDDTLSFIVSYYDYEYAGYLFKTRGNNYYKNKDNCIFDLKYLIEKDMKIPIEKIPLYLTKYALQKKSRSLYHVLHNLKRFESLYDWVNCCYPNKFIINDFEVNAYRCEFDSDEESQIHDILKENFKNVLYNQRNTDREINLEGKVPDWFIFTSNGCYLIEYFGLYVDRSNNSRINDYRERTNNKLEKYKNLNGYKFIALYPSDLDNNFEGLYSKIKEID